VLRSRFLDFLSIFLCRLVDKLSNVSGLDCGNSCGDLTAFDSELVPVSVGHFPYDSMGTQKAEDVRGSGGETSRVVRIGGFEKELPEVAIPESGESEFASIDGSKDTSIEL
jgi:hypothetical protein